MRRIYNDIDPVADAYGVAVLPGTIGQFRAVAKMGDYDGRLLLVDKGGNVVDLPGPAHYLAYDRFLLVEYRSDVYVITIFDISGKYPTFAADHAVLGGLMREAPSTFAARQTSKAHSLRWKELSGTIYLWAPPTEDVPAKALRLDKEHGGLVPATLSPDETSRAKEIALHGLEAWKDCSCQTEPAPDASKR